MAVFKVLSHRELANAPAQKASKAALIALGWTCLLNKYGDAESNVFKTELPRLIEYQSLLYQIIVHSANERLIDLARNVLIEILECGYFEKYMPALLEKDVGLNFVVFMAALLTLRKQTPTSDPIADYKDVLVEKFLKSVILTKTKPNLNSVLACKVIINSVTQVEFEEKILQPMQRSMLRNPEIIMEAVCQIIRHINIDLSPYGVALGKILIQYLHSKDETSRCDSLECFKQLSAKISDLDVISELLKEIFLKLKGTEGKITVAEYRITLIQVSLRFKNYTLFSSLFLFYALVRFCN